jgi:hypothetical protein
MKRFSHQSNTALHQLSASELDAGTDRAENHETRVDDEILKCIPKAFAIDSPESANWLVRKIVEARQYASRVKAWAEQEQRRAERDEKALMFLFGRQLEAWAAGEITALDGKRKSLALPSGTVGFRKTPSKLVIDDEDTVLRWARTNCPRAVVVMEKLSKSALEYHAQETGEIPASGAHIEPVSDRFFIR